LTLIDHLSSLQERNFHKLIVGAALKDFKSIEEYAYYFTHAQADAIDISAFPHSVISAKKGIAIALRENNSLKEPLIMISVNIGEDPHFRRVEVDFDSCTKCLECIPSCPSEAFSSNDGIATPSSKARNDLQFSYNIDLCFGCSNCIPTCKDNALSFNSWNAYETESLQELSQLGARAIELHLNNDLKSFSEFYKKIPRDYLLESFCIGSNTASAAELKAACDSIIEAVYKKHSKNFQFIIQVDGIPLSGARDLNIENKDQFSINKAKLIIEYIAQNYSEYKDQIYIQIAGGTNENSLENAHKQNIPINGVAIGSYARKKLLKASTKIEAINLAKDLVKKFT
jgi:NAD-dependent dihydropyrimidine dehydrogenase PreA subunit